MKKIIESPYASYYVLLYALLLFLPLLGGVHLFDWDEINFAESAREMLLTGDYFHVQINFDQFWEKPPLFIWLQALSMSLFGVNEMAARLPNALVGACTLLVLFRIGKKHYSAFYGFLWMFVYSGTVLAHLYFKSGIIDPIFNLFIFLGIYRLALLSNGAATRSNALLAGLFIGLAVLTKGPVALLLVWISAVVFSITKRQWLPFSWAALGWFTLAFLPVTFLWYGVELIQNGPWFLLTFIQYQIRLFTTPDAGHGGPIFYHFLVLLLGCFPSSLLIFKSFRKSSTDSLEQSIFKHWMIILLAVVLVVFSIANTKIVHYSSLCYFPITFLATDFLHKLYLQQVELPRYASVFLLLLGSLIGLLVMLLPLVALYKESIIPLIRDPFAVANLGADISWNIAEMSIGFGFLLILWGAFILKSRITAFRSLMLVFAATILFVQSTLYLIVPKVEGYSQRAAIEHFQSLQGKDCYVATLDYKSYAHLFYFDKQAGNRAESKDIHWLLEGEIDKPVYFVGKINKMAKYQAMPQLENIGSKNGFVFYLRKPR